MQWAVGDSYCIAEFGVLNMAAILTVVEAVQMTSRLLLLVSDGPLASTT